MQLYNCIIIEDEPLAAGIIEDYIAEVPFLTFKNNYPDAIAALDGLQSNDIDVIFLDLNLPKLGGLDFIQTLKRPPHIIITTAYHEFALQGYEHNVVDYLLKPIEFNRFLKAVNKLKELPLPGGILSPIVVSKENDYMFVNTNKKKIKILYRDILYIESLKEYVRIVTKEKSLITKFQLGQIEELLPKPQFMRIHRSFIVGKDKIEAYTSSEIEVASKQFPIGRSYKELVSKMLDQ